MSKLTRHPHVIWDLVDGEMVLCHTDSNEFFQTDSIGGQIWENFEEHTIVQMADLIHASHPNSDYKQLRAEIQQFIISLEAAGLLERQD